MGYTNRHFIITIDDDDNVHHGKVLRMHIGFRRARSNNIRQECILIDRRKARVFKRRLHGGS